MKLLEVRCFIGDLFDMRSKSKLEGFLDICNTEKLEGWAWVKDKPHTPIEVDIYDSDTFLTRIPANIFRQDLLDTGKGNGQHCFIYDVPPSLKDQKPLFRVKFARTNVDLSNSPMPLIMMKDPSKSKFEGFLDVYNTTTLEGWAWVKDKPHTPIEVDIYDSDTFLARIPANIFRHDLLDAEKGNGRHGFIYIIPSNLKDRKKHFIRVKFAGTNVELTNSPMQVKIMMRDPLGTRKRRWYELGVIGLRIIWNEGWKSFLKKFKAYRSLKKHILSNIEIPKIPKLDLISGDVERTIDQINTRISIVIPTKNVGQNFEFTLERIQNQEGIKEIEIIVVDSGSTDETVDLAKKYGAKVFCIKPEEFDHGLTRNYGVEQATGDYILLMGGDVIPIGNFWLYTIVKVLESDSRIAAASCRQVPKSDADLFAFFTLLGHYKAMEFYEDKIVRIPKNFEAFPPLEKRKLCGLDDVCCMYRKDVFEKFKFKQTPFAEDIDMGLKLIRTGYKLAFLHSVGVIHSHRTITSYVMRKYYTDKKILSEIFNDKEYYPDCSFDELLFSSLVLYSKLNIAVKSIKEFLRQASDSNRYISATIKLEDLMLKDVKSKEITFSEDQMLNKFFDKFNGTVGERRTNDKFMNYLLHHYLISLESLKDFLRIYSTTKDDFIDTLYKIFITTITPAFAIKLPVFKDGRADKIERLLEGEVPLGG